MDKITSFTINHLKLLPGIYVSRKDTVCGHTVTTFDLRMTQPNYEPVINTAEIHTIEHLGATFLRNHAEYSSRVLYFGPMGCRTGFYLLLSGDYESKDIVPLMTELFEFIRDFEGEVPGAAARDCGNYLDTNLDMALMRSILCIRKTKKVRKKSRLRSRQIGICPDLSLLFFVKRLPPSSTHKHHNRPRRNLKLPGLHHRHSTVQLTAIRRH